MRELAGSIANAVRSWRVLILSIALACAACGPGEETPGPRPARPKGSPQTPGAITTLPAFPEPRIGEEPEDATLDLLAHENAPGQPVTRRDVSNKQGVAPGPVTLQAQDGLLFELNGKPPAAQVLECTFVAPTTTDGELHVHTTFPSGAQDVLTYPVQLRAGRQEIRFPLWQRARKGARLNYMTLRPGSRGKVPVEVLASALRPATADERRAAQWTARGGSTCLAVFLEPGATARLRTPGDGRSRMRFAYLHAQRARGNHLAITGTSASGERKLTYTSGLIHGEPEDAWRPVSLLIPEGVRELEFRASPSSGIHLSAVRFFPLKRPRGTRPDVLVITGDTLRADHLQCYGSEITATPTLDALARNGVLFEQMYSVANVTNPAHISLFTSLYLKDHAVTNNRTLLSDEAVTLAESLQARGYLCFAALGARHIGPDISNLGQGFDQIAASKPWVRLGERVLERLKEIVPLATPEPLFLWVHLFDPHTPYQPPKPFDGKYYEGEDPEKAGDELLPEAFRRELSLPITVRDAAYPRAQYRAEVDYLDHVVNLLLQFLKQRRRERITLLVGDHGEAMGEHGSYFNHRGLFHETLHVPCILVGPSLPRAKRHAGPTSTIDLLPTLCHLLDTPLPRDARGRSLLPTLRGAATPTPVFAEHANELSAALLSASGLHVLHRKPARDASFKFDIAPGTFETINLQPGPPGTRRWVEDETVAERVQIEAWLEDRRPLRAQSAELDAETRSDLEKLGYTGK